jgi:hypothetical protein
VSLVEYCVLLKIIIQAGLNGIVHFHDEFVCWIPTFVAVHVVLYYRDISPLINRNVG